MLGKILNLFRYRKPRIEHWFRLEIVPDVLSGKKNSDGSLYLEIDDKYQKMDITIPDITVPKLVEWLNRAYPQVQENTNAVRQLEKTLPISGTTTDPDTDTRPLGP